MLGDSKKQPVWLTWRKVIRSSDLPSTTRLVLFNLAGYLNDEGEGAFPSVPRQAKDTGLTERSIYKALKIAEDGGYLTIGKFKIGKDNREKNIYTASAPDDFVNVPSEAFIELELPERGSGVEQLPLNIVHPTPERGSVNSLNVVHPNSSLNSSDNSSVIMPKKVKPIRKTAKSTNIENWEQQNGLFNFKHIAKWAFERDLDPDKVLPKIEYFRNACIAHGREYADFAAAFKNWFGKPEDLQSMKLDGNVEKPEPKFSL